MQRKDGPPVFIVPLKYKHYGVPFAYAQPFKVIGCFIRVVFHFGKCEISLFPCNVCPSHSQLVGRFFRQLVYAVIGEVKVFGYFQFIVFIKIFIIRVVLADVFFK